MKQGCRLARLFGKSIRDFYARNQYFLMNTQPKEEQLFFLNNCSFLFYFDFGFVRNDTTTPDSIAAVIPAAPALNGPVKIPSQPYSLIACFVP